MNASYDNNSEDLELTEDSEFFPESELFVLTGFPHVAVHGYTCTHSSVSAVSSPEPSEIALVMF